MAKFVEFVCPMCKSEFQNLGQNLHCSKCNESYRSIRGVLNFLPNNLNKIKQVEVETYSIRADKFNKKESLKMGRKEFTEPLRALGKDGVFLELCGGAGHHALNMMKDGYKVVESDIAPGAVKKTHDIAKELEINENGEFVVIDAENLPFPDNTFKGVFLISSLHHLPDPEKALKEIYRVLKPGGILLIGYEPNTWHYYAFYPFFVLARKIIRARSKHPISIADDETFGFSETKLKKLVRSCRFNLKKIKPVDFSHIFYCKTIEILNKILGLKLHKREKIESFLKKIDLFCFKKIPYFHLAAINHDVIAQKTEMTIARQRPLIRKANKPEKQMSLFE